MNRVNLRNAKMDIDSVEQYFNLASRAMQRAIIILQAERMTAEPKQRAELERVSDQCGPVLKLIDQAMEGIDEIELPQKLELPEACSSKRDWLNKTYEAVHHA